MTQTNISEFRRNEIKKAVIFALKHSNSTNIPVEIKCITRSFKNIRLISYSKHMRIQNISYNQMLSYTETIDACTDYYADNNMYYIYYNDLVPTITKSNRYRWNIAHELGHVLLNHHIQNEKTRIFRYNLSNDEYNTLENEADYFAQLMLVPHAALLGFQIKNANYIKIMCKISEPAAKRRYYEFIEWKSHLNPNNEYDKKIFQLYFNFIFKRKCKICGVGLIQRYGKHCPICGQKNSLEWGEGDIMKYPLLETYKNGKLNMCPNCQNEETDVNGEYCQICGRSLINKCINGDCSNTEMLPSNARYCPICGNKSTFLQSGMLEEWNYREHKNSADNFFHIPDIDEELPFN